MAIFQLGFEIKLTLEGWSWIMFDVMDAKSFVFFILVTIERWILKMSHYVFSAVFFIEMLFKVNSCLCKLLQAYSCASYFGSVVFVSLRTQTVFSNKRLCLCACVFQGDQMRPETEAGCGGSDCLGETHREHHPHLRGDQMRPETEAGCGGSDCLGETHREHHPHLRERWILKMSHYVFSAVFFIEMLFKVNSCLCKLLQAYSCASYFGSVVFVSLRTQTVFSNKHLCVCACVFQGDQMRPETEAGCGGSDCLGETHREHHPHLRERWILKMSHYVFSAVFFIEMLFKVNSCLCKLLQAYSCASYFGSVVFVSLRTQTVFSNKHLCVCACVFQGDQMRPETEAGCGGSDCLGETHREHHPHLRGDQMRPETEAGCGGSDCLGETHQEHHPHLRHLLLLLCQLYIITLLKH
ncbi:hypothetical protein PAMA_007495 [Pampus argenteus]